MPSARSGAFRNTRACRRPTPRLPTRVAPLSPDLGAAGPGACSGHVHAPVPRIASCSRVFALERDQTFPDAGGVINGVSQRCLKLSGEVEAFIRSDEVGGAQVEVFVEPVPQIEQDRLEVGDQLSVRYLRGSLLVHGGCRRVNSKLGPGAGHVLTQSFGSPPGPARTEEAIPATEPGQLLLGNQE